MTMSTLDQQFKNLFARAMANPYFDLERALCVTLESHMQQRLAVPCDSSNVQYPFSIVKVFAWPSEELCACIRKADKDHLYHFEVAQKNLFKIESTEPILRPIEKNDRVLILNQAIAELIQQDELEQIISDRLRDSDETLKQEICLRAQVNARGNEHVFPETFVVHILTP